MAFPLSTFPASLLRVYLALAGWGLLGAASAQGAPLQITTVSSGNPVYHVGDPIPDLTALAVASGGTGPITITQMPYPGIGTFPDPYASGDFEGLTLVRFYAMDSTGAVATSYPILVRLLPLMPEVQVLRATGDAAPGLTDGAPSLGRFRRLGLPSRFFEIAFVSVLSSGRSAVIVDDDQVAAVTGQGAPGTGARFASFGTPFATSFGAGFSARLSRAAPVGGKAPAPVDSLWAYTRGLSYHTGSISEIAEIGWSAPGASGPKFVSFSQVVSTYFDRVMVVARLEGGRSGLWQWRSRTGLELVALEGQQVTVGDGPKTIATLSALGSSGGAPDSARSVSSSYPALLLRFTDGTSALARTAPDAPAGAALQIALRSDVPVSLATLAGPVADATWTGLFPPALIGAPRNSVFAFHGRYTVAGALPRDATVIETAAGDLVSMAQSGDPVPGLPGASFVSFADPVSVQPLAGLARIAGAGVTPATSQVVYATPAASAGFDAGDLAIVARSGDPAPGTSARFGRFLACARPTWANPGLIWQATLAPGAHVGAANNLGLWYRSAAGASMLVLRTGTLMSVRGVTKRLSNFAALTPVAGSIEQPRFFDWDHNVVVLASFVDGSQAILAITLP